MPPSATLIYDPLVVLSVSEVKSLISDSLFITIKTSERNGRVVTILVVDEEDEIMLITDIGKIIRLQMSGINVISRNTQGVKLIGMEPNERLVSAARLAEKEE